MTTRRWLIFLANAVEIFHHKLLSTLLGVGWLCFSPAVAMKAIAYSVLGTVMCVSLTQILFRGPHGGDCALSVFECSLRGLGGEEFDLKRLHSMVVLANKGMSHKEIYRYSLLKSGVFLLVTTLLLIIISVSVEYFIF